MDTTSNKKTKGKQAVKNTEKSVDEEADPKEISQLLLLPKNKSEVQNDTLTESQPVKDINSRVKDILSNMGSKYSSNLSTISPVYEDSNTKSITSNGLSSGNQSGGSASAIAEGAKKDKICNTTSLAAIIKYYGSQLNPPPFSSFNNSIATAPIMNTNSTKKIETVKQNKNKGIIEKKNDSKESLINKIISGSAIVESKTFAKAVASNIEPKKPVAIDKVELKKPIVTEKIDPKKLAATEKVESKKSVATEKVDPKKSATTEKLTSGNTKSLSNSPANASSSNSSANQIKKNKKNIQPNSTLSNTTVHNAALSNSILTAPLKTNTATSTGASKIIKSQSNVGNKNNLSGSTIISLANDSITTKKKRRNRKRKSQRAKALN